jgi:hypothetical protein
MSSDPGGLQCSVSDHARPENPIWPPLGALSRIRERNQDLLQAIPFDRRIYDSTTLPSP